MTSKLCRLVGAFALFAICVSPLCADETEEVLAQNRNAFYKKLRELRWIAYNPTTFAPGKKSKPDEIKADLQTLIEHGFKPGQTGICTYSASPDSGHDAIPKIAKDLGFAGVILGVWTISDEGENKAARDIAKRQLVDAICCGNEGYEVRYSWEELRDAMRAMRKDTLLPVSTSEQVEDYGDPNLVDSKENDWLYPNIHPIYRNHTNVRTAARFVHSITNKLAKRSSVPILVHETGWVSSGLVHHTPTLQLEFWKAIHARETKHNICLFEAYNQDWKVEKYRGVDIGASWGLFTSDRQPKPVVELLTGYRAPQDEIGKRFYIFEDEVAAFVPAGHMPDGRGISMTTTSEDTPFRGRYCIKTSYRLADNPWVGVAFLLDGNWKPKRQFNLYEAIDAKPGESVVLRFHARSSSGAAVKFKFGGVDGDSQRFAVETPLIRLSPDYRQYQLNLSRADLRSVVGALTFVLERENNVTPRGPAEIGFCLDDVYVTKLGKTMGGEK